LVDVVDGFEASVNVIGTMRRKYRMRCKKSILHIIFKGNSSPPD